MSFGKRLAELRNKRGLIQTDLAKHIGMSHSSVASWETGTRDPDSEMIAKLADFFGVTTDYLLKGDRVTNGDANKLLMVSNDVEYWQMRALKAEEQVYRLQYVIDKIKDTVLEV